MVVTRLSYSALVLRYPTLYDNDYLKSSFPLWLQVICLANSLCDLLQPTSSSYALVSMFGQLISDKETVALYLCAPTRGLFQTRTTNLASFRDAFVVLLRTSVTIVGVIAALYGK